MFVGFLPEKVRSNLDRYKTTLSSSVDACRLSVKTSSDSAKNSLSRINLPQSLEEYLAGDGVPMKIWKKVRELVLVCEKFSKEAETDPTWHDQGGTGDALGMAIP